ncbi:MAG: hypothetical protein AB7U75_14615 [Hyphomicrobiaceae bacterium]
MARSYKRNQFYMVSAQGDAFTTSNPEWHKDSKEVGRKEWQTARELWCRKQLKKLLRPGDTVYVILRTVSGSGMSRTMSLYAIDRSTKKPRTITNYAADLMGWSVNDQGYLRVSGCGMDMGFHAVYTLGASIWPKGTPKPHGKRNGEPDSDGGYALRHEWL